MTMIQKRLTTYIGRFSPFHKGHSGTIARAAKVSDKILIIIGSSYKARDIKNPWTFKERAQMISDWYKSQGFNAELVIVPQRDYPYSNQRWLADIQQHVTNASEGMSNPEVYLTGSDRDDSTFYLKEFPAYKLDLVPEEYHVSKFLSATSIRDLYLGNKLNNRELSDEECDELNRAFLPENSAKFLEDFRSTSFYETLALEHEFQVEHDRKWAAAPYAPIFVTVDAVVIQTGHILLVKRRNAPGKGLWALPGGYLNRSEWTLTASIRELIEETKIDVPRPVIYGSQEDDYWFEAPSRSIRGRLITHAFLYKLPDFLVNGLIKLPKVKGEDDAVKAKWFPLSEVSRMGDVLFEDHYDIIETMLARLEQKR